MKWLVGLTVIAVVIAIYVTWFRPWMRTTVWGKAFLDWIEPMERVLWWKSETILWARLKMVAGAVLAALTTLGAIDITPLMPFVPDAYEPMVKAVFNLLPLVITAMGWVDEKLRKETTKPLEIVAMRTDAPAEVKAAAAQAEAVTAEAKAAVVQSEPV